METLQDFNKIYPSTIFFLHDLYATWIAHNLFKSFSFFINFLISLIFFDSSRHLKKIIEEGGIIIISS